MNLNEKVQELVYDQGEISIKDLIKIFNQCDERDTILVNFSSETSVIDLKILNSTMISQISTKCVKIEGACGDGSGICTKKCAIYSSCKG